MVLEELLAEHKRRRGHLRKRVAAELHYLESGRMRMDYARFEAAGWPIGSGAVEGECKHLVKARFNLTGARWRRANIEPVLALRLSRFNEECEQDWSDHPKWHEFYRGKCLLAECRVWCVRSCSNCRLS